MLSSKHYGEDASFDSALITLNLGFFEVLKIRHEVHNEGNKVNDIAMASPKWPLKPNGKAEWKWVKM